MRSKTSLSFLLSVAISLLRARGVWAEPVPPHVFFSDTTRIDRPFAKDPSVIEFQGRYLMYYSLPPHAGASRSGSPEGGGWGIGIASSKDLVHWSKVGDIAPTQPIEKEGIVAPGARVLRGQVHLFYQSYGHGAKDAICHAVSSDGVHFTHDASNPIYRPTQMPWSVGRAIDAEVFLDESAGKVYLYFATRDPGMVRQLIGMAEADLHSNFAAGTWRDVSTSAPLLAPELPWEGLCIEAPSVMKRGKVYYMFYAGAYNNVPQQIGVARSPDGIHWTRISDRPFLANGAKGTWNSSESGHPGVINTRGKTYLFYQGNDDGGKTYHISMVPVEWQGETPVLARSSPHR